MVATMAKDSPVALETEWVTVGQSERLTNLGHSKTYELINNGTLSRSRSAGAG